MTDPEKPLGTYQSGVALATHRVDFVVIVLVALQSHGQTRTTIDPTWSAVTRQSP